MRLDGEQRGSRTPRELLPPALASGRPVLAVIANSFTPYRMHLHRRIASEMCEFELASIYTHGESNSPWAMQQAPETNPVLFGTGEKAQQQDRLYRALHEWRKGGRIIRWLRAHHVAAVLVGGYNDLGRLRIIRWCAAHGVPCGLVADSNIRGDHVLPWLAPLKRMLVSYVVGKCRWILPCGTLGAAYFKRYGATDQQIYFFPYEPDYELIRSIASAGGDAAIRRFSLKAGRRRLIYSGRLVPVKRVDLVIDAFVAIADQRLDWDLVIAGDGPLRVALEAKVPLALRDRVIWTGFIDSQSIISGLYHASDVLVLASDFEPWALIVNEAVAAGLAVVASDNVGAAEELVRDSVNGRIFPAGNMQALIDALLEVTLPENVGRLKGASASVLAAWREVADPVDGLRRALATVAQGNPA